MIIYWSFMVLALLLWFFAKTTQKVPIGEDSYKVKERVNCTLMMIVFFGVVCFFCGLRSGIADTGAYIHMFKGYPVGLDNIVWEDVTKDQGFYFLSVMYKTFISDDFHGWLFLICFISCFATALAFKRYSSDPGFSCFLFIATTTFTYLINGMRQYIAVSILFALSYCIEEKRFIKYLVYVLLLSTIHFSAIIMIPVFFLVRIKPWSPNTWALIIVAVVVGVGFDSFMPAFDSMLEGSSYSDYSDVLQNGAGSSIFRLAIAAVPVIMSYVCKDRINETEDKMIPIATNMSIINMALYIVATFSSGMTIGRLTIYFDMYNLILLPWLLNNWPSTKERKLFKIIAIIAYIAFFYFQMIITWGGWPYESDILNMFIYGFI